MRPNSTADFWSRVDRSAGPDACWPWRGNLFSRGYGRFLIVGRTVRAHRYALELTIGRRLEPGEFACHHCDNPPCVNPAHLYVGNDVENVADRVRRGHSSKGERHPNARLNEALVRDLRARHDRAYTRALARRMGMSEAHLDRVVRGECWRHV